MALLSINPAGRERIINPGSIYIRICNPNEPGGTNPAQHKGFLPRLWRGKNQKLVQFVEKHDAGESRQGTGQVAPKKSLPGFCPGINSRAIGGAVPPQRD